MTAFFMHGFIKPVTPPLPFNSIITANNDNENTVCPAITLASKPSTSILLATVLDFQAHSNDNGDFDNVTHAVSHYMIHRV
jgi:hypothetical protein